MEGAVNFSEVHAMIPYCTEGEVHSNTLQIYPDVRVKYPGRHAMDTDPVGGDFVVEVDCEAGGWKWKQFTHGDIFKDIETKSLADPTFMRERAASDLARVVEGENIKPHIRWEALKLPGIRYRTLLEATQCLAVAEHRRYHKYDAGGGGRYLPLRYAVGIIYGHWDASSASKVQRRGIHGYKELTKEFGNPPTVKSLLKENTNV